jgi:hypothetical protein
MPTANPAAPAQGPPTHLPRVAVMKCSPGNGRAAVHLGKSGGIAKDAYIAATQPGSSPSNFKSADAPAGMQNVRIDRSADGDERPDTADAPGVRGSDAARA